MKCAAVSVCRLADNAETQDFTVTSLLICFLISAIKAVVSSDVLISGLCLGVDLLCVGTCAASVCRLVPLSLKTAQPLSFRLCLRFPLVLLFRPLEPLVCFLLAHNLFFCLVIPLPTSALLSN